MNSEARIVTGPGQRVKRILIAALDENDKPVFSTMIRGSLECNVDTDTYETHLMDGTIVSSWDTVSEMEITVRGRPEQA